MKRVMVTGGTGYIGSHTVVELIERGFEPVIVDDLSNSRKEILNRIEQISGHRPEFHKVDLADASACQDLFNKVGSVESIIHFAAYKAVGESVAEPLKYYRNNLNSLINLLDCMTRHEVNSMVFSSSCTVYGQPEQLPVDEMAPVQKAESPYGNTKQIGEEIIQDYIKANKSKRIISLRYFNPIGAHKSGLIGELPNGVPANLVPFVTQAGIGIRDEIKVFGGDYDTPDGSAVRDYIHVVDLAQAHLVALDRLINLKGVTPYEFFNLGTGTGYSVLDIINSFERVTDQKLNYKVVDRRAGDIEQIYSDTKRANEVLGWKAQKSLDDALSSAWNWEKNLRDKPLNGDS